MTEQAGAFDYPRDHDGEIFGNFVQAPDAARPRFMRDAPVGAAPQRPTMLVLGAGFTGVSATLRLAELNRAAGSPARILLLEAGRAGCGPSGKNAGQICGLQPAPAQVLRHCGPALAERLTQAATSAADLVRDRIARHAIPCDLRDGFVEIRRDGSQVLARGGRNFGIEPYPFVLGLAMAAREAGAEIHEGVRVDAIEDMAEGCRVVAGSETLRAAYVVASGGHRMAERIALLAPLRARTTELRVSTLITEPLSEQVQREILPGCEGERFPFANDAANVAYGGIDRRGRMIFGADATVLRDPRFPSILRALHRLFPKLAAAHLREAGHALRWEKLVEAERICFTADMLPNVGTTGRGDRVHYAHALGGHGIALGTMLGEAVAETVWARFSGGGTTNTAFADFAAVRHRWMPPREPWRGGLAGLGLLLRLG